MSDEEAKGVLRAEVIKLRPSGYEGLVERLAGKKETLEVVGLSRTTYHVELEGFWDDEEHRNLRVVASMTTAGFGPFCRLPTPSRSVQQVRSPTTPRPDTKASNEPGDCPTRG